MSEQQDYLKGEFKRVSPLRPRRAQRVDEDPVIVTSTAPETSQAVPLETPADIGAERPTPGAPPASSAPPAEASPPAADSGERARPERAAPLPVPGGASREERLQGLLDELVTTSTDTEAAAVVSLDGFIMAAALPDGLEEDRVAAMSAAILALGERASGELGRGKLNQVFIEGERGYVLLMSCGSRAALVAMASMDAKLGLVFFDMRRVAADIAAALTAA